MAQNGLKTITELIDTSFTTPRDSSTAHGHADARAFAILLSGLARVCANHTYARRFGVMNTAYKAVNRVLVRVRELEGEGECVVMDMDAFDGTVAVRAMIEVCVCVCMCVFSVCGWLCVYMCTHTHVYKYTYMHTHTHTHIYIHMMEQLL